MAEQGFTVNDFDHLAEASDVAYGIYDTKENCWVGDESGPRLFTRADSVKCNGMPQRIIAQIAAQMAEIQVGYSKDGMAGRLRAQEFHGQDLVHKDSVDTLMTPLEALTKLEGSDD